MVVAILIKMNNGHNLLDTFQVIISVPRYLVESASWKVSFITIQD